MSIHSTWDSVGDRHEGGVEGGHNGPHRVISDNAAQAEGRRHVGEGGIGRGHAESRHGPKASCHAE